MSSKKKNQKTNPNKRKNDETVIICPYCGGTHFEYTAEKRRVPSKWYVHVITAIVIIGIAFRSASPVKRPYGLSPVLLAGSFFGQNQLHPWAFRSGPASSFKVSTRLSLFARAFSVRIGLVHKIALFWIGCIRKRCLRLERPSFSKGTIRKRPNMATRPLHNGNTS